MSVENGISGDGSGSIINLATVQAPAYKAPASNGTQESIIKVFPKQIEFKDAEAGTIYVGTISVKNMEAHVKRIRFVPPSSAEFHLHYEPNIAVAPGLEATAEVEFLYDGSRDCFDEVVVCCEDERISVPLRALKPCPHIEFEGFLNLGIVPLDSTAFATLTLTNNGLLEGTFDFVFDESHPLQITPKSGTVPPRGGVEKIKVEFKSVALGVFRSLVQVKVGKPQARILDVNATVVRQRLECVYPNKGGIVDNLHFGQIYFGQKRVLECCIVNDGPEPSNFSISLHSGQVPADDAAAMARPSSPPNPAAAALTVTPKSASLEPYQEARVAFDFAPLMAEKLVGFKNQKMDKRPDVMDVQMFVAIACTKNNQTIRIPITGKAVEPCLEVSQRLLTFGECPRNEHVDINITIKNGGELLPIEFAIAKVAHFYARPASGRLLPLQSQQVTVTFAPNQRGNFKSKLVVTSGGDVGSIDVVVTGACSSEGRKKQLPEGPVKLPEDFLPTFNYVAPEKFQDSKREAPWQRPKPWSTVHPEQTSTSEAFDAHTVEQRFRHRDIYNNFLKHERQTRAQMEKQKSITKLQDCDIGMDPASGLREPHLELPREVDPLWMAPKATEPGSMFRPRIVHHDEDQLFSKKFKAKPTTAEEQRQCKAPLMPKELMSISTSQRVLDFGVVCVNSVSSKSFTITNGTKQHIACALSVDAEQLKRSTPDCQILPPGTTAGFDITLFSDRLGKIEKSVSYTINENHTYTFTVKGEFVPMMIKMSKSQLDFRFNNLDFFVKEVVTVSNPGNSRAEFKWICPSATFLVNPSVGVIDKFSSMAMEVTWRPMFGAPNSEELKLQILGGPEKTLKCVGEIHESSCSFSEKKVDFGVLCVGVKRIKTATIKNTGQHECVFGFDERQSKCLTISPAKGRVAVGESVQVQICLKSVSPEVLDVPLILNVRGGKSVKLTVVGEVKYPQLDILQDEFNFGGVYLGAVARLPITIVNSSNVGAILTMDFQMYQEFGADLPPELLEMDDVEDVEEEQSPRDEDGATLGLSARHQFSINRLTARASSRSEDGGATDRPTLNVGKLFKFKVVANSRAEFTVLFSPQKIRTHTYELPLSLVGLTGGAKGIRRAVVGNGLKPRLLLSQTVVDFGDKVIVQEEAKSFSYTMEVTLTNGDPGTLVWEVQLDKQDPNGIFALEPSSGSLQPGKNVVVRVTFHPKASGNFSTRAPLYLDRSTQKAYLELEFYGQGVYPMLLFDRQEVMLPVVPLGIKAVTHFQVINRGYDNLEVKCKLPADSSRVPISLSFPEGTMVGIAKERLPVEVSFVTKKPMSFTAKVDFLDSDGNKFTITILGTSDNSVLTIYPFLSMNHNFCVIDVKDGKPLNLLFNESKARASEDRPMSVASSCGDPDAEGDTLHTAELRDANESIGSRSLLNLLAWMNATLLRTPCKSFPGDFIAMKGKPIFELVEFSCGKSPLGATRRVVNNKREQAQHLCAQYEELLTFLKSYGALLNTVRPELLLSFDDFARLGLERFSSLANSPSADWTAADFVCLQQRQFNERHFELLSVAAWVNVVFQIVRVFSLNRVTVKHVRSQPGVGKDWHVVDTTLSNSNCYSVPENLLMAWLTYHHNKLYPSDPVRVSNFGADLKDSKVLAAVILAHVPSMKVLEQVHFFKAKQKESLDSCATILVDAMQELRLDYVPSKNDILEPNPRDTLLLVLYLYQVLPSYIPKTTIEFACRLNETVTKHIELSNPSSKIITYNARMDGSPDFSIAHTTVRLEPQTTVQFPVVFKSRFSVSSEALLMLTTKRSESTTNASNMVFSVKSTVQSFKPSETLEYEKMLYEPALFEVTIQNPFPMECDFQLTFTEVMGDAPINMSQVNTGDDTGRDQKKTGRKKKGEGSLSSRTTRSWPNAPILPGTAFFCKTERLRVGPNGKQTLQIFFMAFRLQKHRCVLHMVDREVGEFAYEVAVNVLLPAPLESIKLSGDSKMPLTKEVVVPPRNHNLERTRQAMLDRLPPAKSREFLSSMLAAGPVQYYVEYSSPLFSGPTEVTLPDLGVQSFNNQKKSTIGIPNQSLRRRAGDDEKEQKLSVTLHPKGAGTYCSKVILKSEYDVRVLEFEATISSMGPLATLEFAVPARQSIVQDIPITNNSSRDWSVTASVRGEFFRGPQSINVPMGATVNYQLTFAPTSVKEVSAELLLTIAASGEKFSYTLHGVADEPLAEDHIVVNCQARFQEKRKFKVSNYQPHEVVFNVESDIPNVSGPATIAVPPGQTGIYDLLVFPQRGGSYTGALTFKSVNGDYLWYTVEVNASPPPAETTIEVKAAVRKAVAIEISVSNPQPTQVEFQVLMNGEGLIGEPEMILGPNETAVYEVVYSPLLPGSGEGSIAFINETVGEFWYKFSLHAEPAEAIALDPKQCEIGREVRTAVTIENPVNEDITIAGVCSNPRDFKVVPPQAVIPPFHACHFEIVYSPTALNETQSTEIVFAHPLVGEWKFLAEGEGLMPTEMDPMNLVAPIGSSVTNVLQFRNPFGTQTLVVAVTLESDEVDPAAIPFSMMLKKTKDITLAPMKELQIPVYFAPARMTDYSATIVVSCALPEMTWRYPLVGVAETPSIGVLKTYSCPARGNVMDILQMTLPGLQLGGPPGLLSFETEMLEESKAMLTRALSLQLLSAAPEPPNGQIRFQVEFNPMRPLHTSMEVIVIKENCGRWRFSLVFDVGEPEVDDVIVIEGALKKTSSVSFRMHNQYPVPTHFDAFFTADTPTELTVYPTEGTLDASDGEGTMFVISFSPTEYGKILVGKLIIQTAEMQWTYEVRGTHPHYVAPKRDAKVTSHIAPQVAAQLTEHKSRNFMKENLQRAPAHPAPAKRR